MEGAVFSRPYFLSGAEEHPIPWERRLLWIPLFPVVILLTLSFLCFGLTACGTQQSPRIDGYVLSTAHEIQYLSWTDSGDGTLTGTLTLERLNPDQGTIESRALSISGTRHAAQVIIRDTPTSTLQGTINEDQTMKLEQGNSQGPLTTVTWYGVSTTDWQALKTAFPAQIRAQQQVDRLTKTVDAPPDLVTSTSLEQGIKDRRATIKALTTQLDNLEQETDQSRRCLDLWDFQSSYQRGYTLLPDPAQTSIATQLQQTQQAIQAVKASPVPASVRRVPQPWKRDVSQLEQAMQPAQAALKGLQQTYATYHAEDLRLQQQFQAMGKEFQQLQSTC